MRKIVLTGCIYLLCINTGICQLPMKIAKDSLDMLAGWKFPDTKTNRSIVRLATIVIKDGEARKDTFNYLNHLSRAHAYAALGKNGLAVYDYSKAIEQMPQEFDIILERAELYEKMNKIDLATADYLLVIDRITKSKDEFYRYKANQAFNELRRLSPDAATALLRTNDPRELYQKYYDSAYVLVQDYDNRNKGVEKKILELLNQAGNAYPSTGVFQDTITLLKAITYKKAGNYEYAIAYYKGLTNNNDKHLYDMAMLYKLLGMKKEMLAAYERAYTYAETTTEKSRIKKEWNEAKELDIDPLLFAAGLSKELKTAYRQIIQRGLIEFANGNNKAAINILDSAIAINPIQSKADLYKAIIICKENYNYYKYSETYIKSSKLIYEIAERTNWPDAWYFSGKFYFEQYTSIGRIKCYDKALELTGGKYKDALVERFGEYDISCKDCDPVFDRSDKVARDKQLRKALDDFYSILRLDNNETANKGLYAAASNIYANFNQYDSAVILFRKYVKLLTPDKGYYLYQLKHLAHLQALQRRVSTTSMNNIMESEKLNKEAEAMIKDNYQGYDMAKFQQAIDADKLNPAPLYTLGKYYYFSNWAETWEKVDAAKMATAYNYFLKAYNIDSGFKDVAHLLTRAKYDKEASESWSKLKKAPSEPRHTYTEITNSSGSNPEWSKEEPIIVCPECKGKGISLQPGGIHRPFMATCGMCAGTGIRYGW